LNPGFLSDPTFQWQKMNLDVDLIHFKKKQKMNLDCRFVSTSKWLKTNPIHHFTQPFKWIKPYEFLNLLK